MSYAIDLSSRQSARTLEQAVRQQAKVVLEPRAWEGFDHLLCRMDLPSMELDATPVLTLAVLSRGEASIQPQGVEQKHPAPVTNDDLRSLIGTYVDALILLGEQRYMFSSDLLRILSPTGGDDLHRVHLTRPNIVQVAQRRRFRRIRLSHSAQVDLFWQREGLGRMGGVGWLCNISGDGLACRTEERVADMLWIGDEIEMEFTLVPGDSERFRLQGAVVNKTPTGNLGKTILGVQFATDESHPESARAAQLLRQRLVERAPQLADLQRSETD